MESDMNIKFVILVTSLALAGCSTVGPPISGQGQCITKDDVARAQNEWGEAIVAIGSAYASGKDYKALAAHSVDTLYGYDEGTVLFKPTKAAEKQFRLNTRDAISYFVAGGVSEDHGFAIQPWSKVRFENAGINLQCHSAIAMGNYYFTDAKTRKEVKVEFTFGYVRDENGKLLINLHHSSFPYQAAGKTGKTAGKTGGKTGTDPEVSPLKNHILQRLMARF
jgi:hypothetical protein